jgi:hypothetical protein
MTVSTPAGLVSVTFRSAAVKTLNAKLKVVSTPSQSYGPARRVLELIVI